MPHAFPKPHLAASATPVLEALRAFYARQAGQRGPLYHRLAEALREAVDAGPLHVGQGLPSERDIAAHLGLSRVTVRRAIVELTQAGLLTVRRGAGAYVSPRIEQPLSILGSFTEDIQRRGRKPGSHWLSRDIGLPAPDDLVALGLSLSDAVLRTARVRTADGEPLAIERAVVRATHVGDTTVFGDSLYAAMARHGVRPVRALQRLRAEIAGADDAQLLGVPAGSAVLYTERRSFDAQGRPVEFTRSLYRGDLYDYVVELRADPLR